MGAVRALGDLGEKGVPHLEAIAKDAKQGDAAAEARSLLGRPREVPGSPPSPKVAASPAEEEKPAKAAPPAPRPRPAAPAPAPAREEVAERLVPSRTPKPAPALAAAPVVAASVPPPAAAPSPAPAVSYKEMPAPSSPEDEFGEQTKEEKPAEPAKPLEPEKPKSPPDGTALALATSLVAGGVWGSGLSLLAQQNNTGVLFLVGGAGAVIGGGTAWGLTHFGLRPSPTQALWFTNSTAWGTLAGLMAWAGSGSDNPKLKWGLLVGGESLGMGMGVLGARKWQWTAPQILFANSLALGAGLGAGGYGMLIHPQTPFHISPYTGYGTAPVMLAAGVASRYLNVTKNDLHLLGASSLAGAWSGGLLAYGLDGDPDTRDKRLAGGFLLGMGLGYLGAAVAAPFLEVSPRRLWLSGTGMLAGNLMGLGSYMIAEPEDTNRRPLWAGIGGLGLGVGTFLAYPYLRLGDQAAWMSGVGAAYGAGTWGLAMATSRDGSTPRLQGGLLALGTAGGMAGLLASGRFSPKADDYPVTLASAALGATAGIGVGKLATDTTGTGELAGSLAGSALGFAAGAAFSHYAQLRAPDLGAGALGAGTGALVGALAPSLADAEWGGWLRSNQGGLLLGLPAGVFASVAFSHLTNASGASVAVASAGSALGLGMGLGTGLLWPESYSQPSRIGAVTGVSAGLAAALLLEHPLRLNEGLGPAAPEMGAVGAGLGIAEGSFLAALVDPSGQVTQTSSRQIGGGMLLGGSAGLAAGLVLSKYFTPTPRNLAVTAGGAVLGGLFGRGLAMTVSPSEGRGDAAGTMAGLLAGATGLALAEHRSPLTDIDFAASAEGALFGGITGALAPTLADGEWGGWRRATDGGLLLGVGGGALAGAVLSHVAAASPATIAVSSAGGVLGLGMGAGTGLLWPENYSQPTRIGMVAGVSAGLATSLLLEHPLRLHEGLGDSALGMGVTGTGIGIAEGLLLASLVDSSGQVTQTSDRQLRGGTLLGASAGLASGLVLSKFFTPGPRNLAVTASGSVLGGLFGRGLAMTVSGTEGRGDAAGTMAGVLLGTTAFGLVEHRSPLTDIDLAAGGAGMAFGGALGALAPTLADAEWGGWRRRTEGGLLLGLGGGAMAGAAVSHLARPTPETLVVGSTGGVLGLGMGLGTGLLWPEDYSQPSRIGAVAGITGGMAAALLLEHPLRLDEGLGESAAGVGAVGAGLGIAEGILLAALIDPSGEVSQTSARQHTGGALLGGSAGLASGLVLSKFYRPAASDLAVTVGGSVLGGLFGRGLMMTATESDGRRDTAGTMAGSLAGTVGFALLEHFSPLTQIDAAAGGLGMAYGGVVGALMPTLADAQWGGWRRSTEGGLLLGVGGGAMAAAGLAHATSVSGRTLGFGMAGALDGALTGIGVGILADTDPASTQGARIGAVAGATSGLLVGLGLWPRLEFDTDNLIFLSAASAVGGWTGAWSQVLGHGSLKDVDGAKVGGGLMAGAGGASFLATALLPALRVDTDLIGDALLTDMFFSGAGAGTGALISRRADAPVWGMLGAGTAGLLLGGTLHERIAFGPSSGLLTFGTLEGLWAGAWLPYAMRPSSEVTETDHVAGVAAGGLGGLGLSLLASTIGTPRGGKLGMAGAWSGIGASVVGGSVLLADNLHDQRGVGIMLGGTAAGLGLGALISPYAPLDGRRSLFMLGGASFGLAEGLAFGWAGRATSSSEFAGSGLIGAGLGATLGLASSANTFDINTQQALVASGFSAWGGWVGSFAGAYANRDPHEVVLGGLAAANVGFLAGYGALRYDLVEPRDFGWLSLAGAMGAALGGGIGAVFSTQSNPRPVLAGLALGPVVGIGAGAVIVPRLRHKAESAAAFFPPPRVAGVRFALPAASENGKQRNSADVLAERKPSRFLAGLKLVQHHLFDVTNWTPVFGALPPLPGDPNPAPFFMGVSGGLR
jgi:hypothetical protein